MALTHLLIDWENKQPTGAELEQVRGSRFRLWILHGPQQKSFPSEQAKAWQPLGKQVRFVQSMKSGKNALDLHIAFCIGEASEQDRAKGAEACYIIISGDKDFDALFGYLSEKGIKAARAPSLPEALEVAAELTAGEEAKAAPPKPIASPNAQRVIEDLRAHPRNQPTTIKRLQNHVASLLGKQSADAEVDRVLEELKKLKALVLNGTKPTYSVSTK
jgi:hypothetical protein